jgi:hypothetical protein
MYHSVDIAAHHVKQFLYHWSIGAGRGENQLSCINGAVFYFVLKSASTGIYQFVGYGMIIALRIFLCVIFRKDIVTG